MNAKDRDEFHAHVKATTSERAQVCARQLAGSTTLATRFDLTDPKLLEGFLLNAIWLYEHAEISTDKGTMLIAPAIGN